MNSTWVLYHVQNDDGEEEAHPNGFCIPHEESSQNSNSICLSHIHEHFPLPIHEFHFRFRTSSQDGNDTYVWMDITLSTMPIPLVHGKVIAKVLRLITKPRPALYLKRRPCTSTGSFETSSSRSLGRKTSQDERRMPQNEKRNQQYQDEEKPSSTQHKRSPSKPRYQDGEKPSSTQRDQHERRPQRYQDDNSSSSSRREHQHDKKKLQRSSSSRSRQEPSPQRIVSPPPPDLLSGGPAPVRKTAPSKPKPSNLSPVKKAVPQFTQGGQTVGPVTLSEMESVSLGTHDGTSVWNAKNVDKSKKSQAVRSAMEKREAMYKAKAEEASRELRARDTEVQKMETEKANAILNEGARMKEWAEDNGRLKNIRTLLSTMHTVMWQDSRWTEIGLGKVMQATDVKKAYRRAMLVVHPDKNTSGRTPTQVLIAELCFDALKKAWEEFARIEMP